MECPQGSCVKNLFPRVVLLWGCGNFKRYDLRCFRLLLWGTLKGNYKSLVSYFLSLCVLFLGHKRENFVPLCTSTMVPCLSASPKQQGQHIMYWNIENWAKINHFFLWVDYLRYLLQWCKANSHIKLLNMFTSPKRVAPDSHMYIWAISSLVALFL